MTSADHAHARRQALPVVLALAVALVAGSAAARQTDRNQPMSIDADRQQGSLDGNSVNEFTGNVIITQGTLDIRASRADLHQRDGEIVRAVLTGSQAVMKQQMDDGTWMTAKADRIDYDVKGETLVLTGNFSVTTPRGSTSGQRMTYNMRTGAIDSGGQGNGRVSITINPKAGQPTPPKGND